MAFQVHPGQRHECRGAGVLRVIRGGHRLIGEPCGAAQPTAQSRSEREIAKARGPAVLRSWRGRGGQPGIEDAGRLTEAVRDSKDPDGPRLVFTTADWQAFTDQVKAGEHRPA